MTTTQLELTDNARDVLRARYLRRDESGTVVENEREMFGRVAETVAAVEARYGGDPRRWADRFAEAMLQLEFLPNSPALMNAGTPLGQLAACFVLPVEDSLHSIFTAIHDAALIHQTGGGAGYDFSALRPAGDVVASTGGVSSGPVSFMRVFDASVEAIRQGGRRRGANMGILDARHPDIQEFVDAKRSAGRLTNFNLSVSVPDDYMRAATEGDEWGLINPRTGTVAGRLNASELFDRIAEAAWATGDPGMIFLDRINRDNPTPELGRITATNPCGEVPLLPYEACMLGSLNLSKFVRDGSDLDWDRLGDGVALAVRFLDDCLDASRFPLEKITEAVQANRKIGLGLMGFADALIDLGIPYDSEEAERLAVRTMSFISEAACEASRSLAARRGAFPNFEHSAAAERGEPPIRNATRTAIAPTGTISIIAGCSSGIEPLYAIAYERHVLEGRTLVETNPRFRRAAEAAGCWTPDLRHQVLHSGRVGEIEEIPVRLRQIYRTAQEITAEWHLRIQAAFQRHVDNAVSKTINLGREADPAQIRRAYERAFELGCKGITVYREGSSTGQVLTGLSNESVCPECGTELRFAEATVQCRACGYATTT